MSWNLLLILSALKLVFSQLHTTYPFDTLQPIVRLSPAKNSGDRFGYSAVAHQTTEVSGSQTYLEALQNTVIMVGAPNGKFPGGLTGIEPSGLACTESHLGLSDSELLDLPLDVIWTCYENVTTGLVYTCPLSQGECDATLGNNNATAPDGLLFDRTGNNRRPDVDVDFDTNVFIYQNKSNQLMGSTMFSTGEYFVACAPLWEFGGKTHGEESQAQGQCVYSNRSLTDFAILQPCKSGLSNNQNLEAFCLLGTGIDISNNVSGEPLVAAGSPGRHFSSGGVYYFNNLTITDDLNFGNEKPEYVPASHGLSPTIRRNYLNVNSSEQQTYYGFAIRSGYFTSTNYTNFVVSAPRWDSRNQIGRVFIVEELNAIASIYVAGETFGEYFGNSLAVSDLNGDGWDDLIVGAPMYSKTSMPETGRIYVYHNINGTLNKSSVIDGFVAFTRFGYSIDSIGDINNDGYGDFAVSAPYEGSGVVYIYYGQERDSTGSIVNLQYAQRIDGSSFVDRVSNISEVNMFGFSLSGGVDIDNNLYNDLVIGAHGSQSVYVLRTRPFADINITAFIDFDVVSLISSQCLNNTDITTSCFNITVCAEYTGKGLDNGFSANYTLREVYAQSQQRLYFNSETDSSITRPIEFSSPDTPSCDTVQAYILNTALSLEFDDFEIEAIMEQPVRSDDIVNTNTVPADLSLTPYMSYEPYELSVPIDSQCGEDDICDLDLKLTHINTTYLGLDGSPFNEQSYLTLDAVTRLDVYVSYQNLAEDVFGYVLLFPLPRDVFIHRLILPQSSFFTCNDTTPTNTTHANMRCVDGRPILTRMQGSINIYLRWLINSTLTASDDVITIPITILSDSTDSRHRENHLDNNQIIVNVDIRSIAEYQTAIRFENSLTYQGNHTPSSDRIPNDVTELGEELRLTASIVNDGPSTIHNAQLTVYIPAKSSLTDNYYFYYPAALQITSGNIVCDASVLNPDGYNTSSSAASSSSSSNRRKRSVTQDNSMWTVLKRYIRQQNNTTSSVSYSLDCRRNIDSCIALKCNVSDVAGTASLDVIGYIDERFFNGKTATYTLFAYAETVITDTFINTTGSMDSNTALVSLSAPSKNASQGIPWYYIAPPAVGGFLIIVIIAIILYFVGFFSRKKREEKANEEDTVVPVVADPFGDEKK